MHSFQNYRILSFRKEDLINKIIDLQNRKTGGTAGYTNESRVFDFQLSNCPWLNKDRLQYIEPDSVDHLAESLPFVRVLPVIGNDLIGALHGLIVI